MISPLGARYLHDTKRQIVKLCSTIRNFTEEQNSIALLAFLADPKDTSDTCGVCGGKAVQNLAYLSSDGAKEVHETYTAIRISTDDHIFHEAWQPVIMERFITKNVLQEADDLVTGALQ